MSQHHINHDGRVAMAAHLATETSRKEQALAAALSRSTDLLGEVVKECDALKVDAGRYRWLRDRAPWTLMSSNGMLRLAARLDVDYLPVEQEIGNEMDIAIDLAMKGKS